MKYNFFAYMARMKLIRRWGLMKSFVTENIAEHSAQVAQLGIVIGNANEHTGDEHALGDTGVVVGDGLEALAGLLGEAV